jgi:YVTN family beta-propeller protein
VPLRISLAERLAVEANGVAFGEGRFQGRQGRLVFAYLVVEQGRPVPREELAEAVWAESPPATWEKGLTVIVSKLRGLLTECGFDGPRLLTSAFGCYRLDLPSDSWVDVLAAERSADAAERALAEGNLTRAEAEAREATSLARRRFLPGEEGSWVEDRRRELAEILSTSLLCLSEVALRSGHPAEAAKHAEEAVALEPFRESGYRRLMEVHAVAGNRAEALRVYERCRRLLADELGAYPSPETESMYRELLAQRTPALNAPAAPDAPPAAVEELGRLTGRRPLALASALGLAAAAAAIAFTLMHRGPASVVVPPNSVAVIDATTNRVLAGVPVGARPTAVAVSRIDPLTRKVVKTIGIGGPAIDLALDGGSVWVANGTAGTLARVDQRASVVAETLDLKGSNAFLPNSVYAVAAGGGAVWVSEGLRSLVRIDGRTHGVANTIDVESAPTGLAVGEDAVWTATTGLDRVLRIEPRTNAITARVAATHPVAIAAGEGAVWVVAGIDSVWRIDPQTGTVTDTIPVGKKPLGVAAAGGSVWVANGGDGTVSRIDPRTNRVVATIALGHTPSAVSAYAGVVWVTIERERIT